uniref:RRM domain-containing protein n=1 Tax=Aedes aegypti TaxID=7159 RepID=A0A0P6J5Q4_AEDAE
MPRLITEEEITLGYSSETDDYESESGSDQLLTAEPCEIYVGNTGKVPIDKYYSMFKQYGAIKDITFWRTHNHLYHCRLVYRHKEEAQKAVKSMHHRKVFGKLIRVSHVLEPVKLNYAAAIRIDDIAAGVTEEEIREHFEQAGEIRFVVKIGYAAYVQFAGPKIASRALRLDMILNGDPYMLCRISADDRIDHARVIYNMKDIKYRKPFVMVENYPELPFNELSRYKENFESIGPVRHFKIAPTGNKTVTLALCMDRADDRDLVIDRFNDAVISGRKLKLYMAPGKARMTPHHVVRYAICKNSVKVDHVPPYFKDYEVCKLFGRCGATISFLEKIANRWIICFDSPTMIPLVREHMFMAYQYMLEIGSLTQETLPINDKLKLRDPDGHKPPTEDRSKSRDLEEAKEKPSVSLYGHKTNDIENILKQALQNLNKETSRQLPTQSVPPSRPSPALKPALQHVEKPTYKDTGYQLPSSKPSPPMKQAFTNVEKPWVPDPKPVPKPVEKPTNFGTSYHLLPSETASQHEGSSTSRVTSHKVSYPEAAKRSTPTVASSPQPRAEQKIGTFSKASSSVAKVTPMQKTSEKPADGNSRRTKAKSSTSWLAVRNKELMQRSVTMSNLPKGINEYDIRELFSEHELKIVTMYCCNDPYHPTSTAVLNFATKLAMKSVLGHHHDEYRGKRVYIKMTLQPWADRDFSPKNTLMLKNLNAAINEEGILQEVEKILGPDTVEDVLKPTHHYAYFDLTGDQVAHKVMHRLRKALINFKIDVFPLYYGIPKRCLGVASHMRKSLGDLRERHGLRVSNPKDREMFGDQFGEHNAHRLFVGNIPRITLAEDVIAYFNNYGTVIDYSQIEKKSCNLRKSAIVSFVDKKHARNAYCQQPHFLEGSRLSVHLMESPPMVVTPEDCKLLSVKVRSRFLTDDEIYAELQKSLSVSYAMRFDAFDDRANFLMFYRARKCEDSHLWTMHHINDESVKIISGREVDPVTEDIDLEKSNTSPFRRQKDSFLGYAVYTEQLKEEMKMHTKPIEEQHVPYRAFYNDQSVQINNVSVNTSLVDFQDLFIKFGDIDYYRELYLEEDISKICFIKFKIDLSADLACTYNQRMLNGKRILIHRAKETLVAEDDRSVTVENLNPATTVEQIYDVFSNVGTVKYVQKQSPNSAIVCMKDKDCLSEAYNVTSIPHSKHMVVNLSNDYQSGFYKNFSSKERAFSIDQIQSILKPRILPEFHQLEIERRNEDVQDEDSSAENEPQGNPEEIPVEDEEDLPPASKRTRIDDHSQVENPAKECPQTSEFNPGELESEPLQKIESIVTTVSPIEVVHAVHPMPRPRFGFPGSDEPRMGYGPRYPNMYPQQQPGWQRQQQIAAMAYNAGPSHPGPRGPPRPMGFHRPPYYN